MTLFTTCGIGVMGGDLPHEETKKRLRRSNRRSHGCSDVAEVHLCHFEHSCFGLYERGLVPQEANEELSTLQSLEWLSP